MFTISLTLPSIASLVSPPCFVLSKDDLIYNLAKLNGRDEKYTTKSTKILIWPKRP